jgi:hypothetical protein
VYAAPPLPATPAHPVENMSTRRAHPVENLWAKKNFFAEYACFFVGMVQHAFFVIHFACSAGVNA